MYPNLALLKQRQLIDPEATEEDAAMWLGSFTLQGLDEAAEQEMYDKDILGNFTDNGHLLRQDGHKVWLQRACQSRSFHQRKGAGMLIDKYVYKEK